MPVGPELLRGTADLPPGGPAQGAAPWQVRVHWIPLGAGTGLGARVVRFNGRVFEALSAAVARRERTALHHAALTAHTPEGVYAIEVTPTPRGDGAARGVVGAGPVGLRSLGRFRLFRYELRCWLGGRIPDLEYAGAPLVIDTDRARVSRVLELVREVPTPTWGRDELHAGEMWNSNSVVSWLLARCGLYDDGIRPPPGGGAPGWLAGLVVAGRERPVATNGASWRAPPRRGQDQRQNG